MKLTFTYLFITMEIFYNRCTWYFYIAIITTSNFSSGQNYVPLLFRTSEFLNSSMFISDCLYHNKLKPFILILNFSHFLINDFKRFGCSSIVLLNSRALDYYNKTANENYNLYLDREKFWLSHAETFIFVELEFLFFKDVLCRLNNTILWNIHATYIIEYSLKLNGCKHAYSFLTLMWDFNVISAIFICRKSSNRIYMYTFNPYNDQAPKEWRYVKSHQQKNGHPFRLFNRPYSSQDKLSKSCNNLYFDKTLTLSQYPLKFCGISLESVSLDDEKRPFKFRGIPGVLNEIIWTKLEANVTQMRITLPGIKNKNRYRKNSWIDILYGKYDGFVNFLYMKFSSDNEINTNIKTNICYVTHKRTLSFMKKIATILSLKNTLIFLTYYLLLIIYFKFFHRQPVLESLMDLLRATFLNSMMNQPKSWFQRMVFICIIFSFVLLNAFIQSGLNSFMTVTSVDYDNIQVIEDLIRLNYTIYSPKLYFVSYNASAIQNFVAVNNLQDCLKILLQDERAACINDCNNLKYSAIDSTKLHISVDKYLEKYYGMIFRNDFPLIKRVQIIYSRILEHGILKHFRRLMAQSLRSKNPDVFLSSGKPTSLEQIQFIFNFVMTSYLFCFAVLMIEIIFQRYISS